MCPLAIDDVVTITGSDCDNRVEVQVPQSWRATRLVLSQAWRGYACSKQGWLEISRGAVPSLQHRRRVKRPSRCLIEEHPAGLLLCLLKWHIEVRLLWWFFVPVPAFHFHAGQMSDS